MKASVALARWRDACTR